MVDRDARWEGRMLVEAMEACDTRLWKFHGRLSDFARPEGLPENRDSRNPVRWLAGEVAGRIQDHILAGCRKRVIAALGPPPREGGS